MSNNPVSKSVVLTSQRSGSYFLEQCLDSHPQIRCYGEILIGFGDVYQGQVPKLFLKNRRTMILWKYVMSGAALRPVKMLNDFYNRGEAQVMTFRAMYNHLRDFRVRNYYLSDTSIRIIHLRRDNLLKQHISRVLMHRQSKLGRKDAHTTKPLTPVSTHIAPEGAIAAMTEVQEEYSKYDQLFSKHPKIELVYEDMIDGPSLTNAASTAITGLFGLDPAPMTSKLVKMNPNRLDQMVENYDELVQALKGTEFERFLD